MNTSAKAVEVKTFIFGALSTDVTDDQIFSQIARIEGEIKQLDQVENKPQKLVKRIEEMKESIQSLIDFVDAR